MALTHGELMFARNLDEKLQKIQDKDPNLFIHNDLNNNKNKNSKMNNNNRPQFVTTVKKGTFLDPPPEIAALLGLGPQKSSGPSPLSGSTASYSSTQTEGTQQADTTTTTTTVVMYSYSSKPKVLQKNYRNDGSKNRLNNARDGTAPYGNLMYDRRVVRGSTYATHATPMDENQLRQKEARRRAQARRKARVYSSRGRQGTPPPVPGRKHEPVQTERFLEELLDRPPEIDASCQTDLFLDRPLTSMYISSSGGEDKETQIYPGELFDFDTEVAPILQNIITRALEQGLSEVLEEEELLDVQVHQRRLQEIHALEELQQKRLSVSDISLLKDARESEMDQEFVPSIANMLPGILSKLQAEGLVIRPQDVDLDWLLDLISARLASPEVLEALVREALRAVGRLDEPLSPENPGEEEEDSGVPSYFDLPEERTDAEDMAFQSAIYDAEVGESGGSEDLSSNCGREENRQFADLLFLHKVTQFFTNQICSICTMSSSITLGAGCLSPVRDMSAFTPYQRVSDNSSVNVPSASQPKPRNENHVPDLRTVLQMYTAAVYALGLQPAPIAAAVKLEDPPDKGSKFLMKNILGGENEKKEEPAADAEQASRLEVLVSSLGKSEAGHRCIYCGKVYSRKYGLKIHIRTHTGYKPLKCKYCLRPFGDPSNLNKHVRLHSAGLTPYRCKECGKVLVRKRDLDRHIVSRHSSLKSFEGSPESARRCPKN